MEGSQDTRRSTSSNVSLTCVLEAGPPEIDHRPRILSLDGGGVRGLSSLLILRNIMEEITRRNGPGTVEARPCEYFDLIGGTGTGGLIAIMLGRLRMV
jgi:patatin-like phospholipase/acyl hydrolase